MQIRNLVVAGMVLVAVAAQSCKKDEVKNVKDTLTSGNWRITAATISPAMDVNGDGVADSNGLGTLIDTCSLDDITYFQNNGVLVTAEGAISCDPTGPQADTTSWALTADESICTIDMLPFTVVSHTSNSVVMSSVAIAFGSTVTFTFTKN